MQISELNQQQKFTQNLNGADIVGEPLAGDGVPWRRSKIEYVRIVVCRKTKSGWSRRGFKWSLHLMKRTGRWSSANADHRTTGGGRASRSLYKKWWYNCRYIETSIPSPPCAKVRGFEPHSSPKRWEVPLPTRLGGFRVVMLFDHIRAYLIRKYFPQYNF